MDRYVNIIHFLFSLNQVLSNRTK